MSDKTHWKLQGPVRRLRSETAEWDAERGTWGASRFYQEVTFDEAGHVVELDQRGIEGTTFRTTYSYDTEGRALRLRAGTVGGEFPYAMSWTYDDRGRLTSVSAAGEDGREQVRSRTTYDERGRRTTVETFPADRPVDSYAIDGSEFSYSAPGAASQTTRYDAAGRSVEVLFHGPDGAPIRRVMLDRDAEGRVLTEEAELVGALSLPPQPGMSDEDVAKMQALVAQAFGSMRTVYEYDDAGRPLTSVQQMGMMGEDRVAYRYDAHGNPIEQYETRVSRELDFDEDGAPVASPDTIRIQQARFAYVYDTDGNWTERTVSTRFRDEGPFAPSNVERRTIEYFR